MTVGPVTTYNQMESVLFGTGNRPWNDATSGSCMFVLANSTYTPAATHTTIASVGTAGVNYIGSGDGAPLAVSSPTIDNSTTPGTTMFKSADANFGASVTVNAKYLICVQPVTAGVIASTSKLLWYVDLNNATTSSEAYASASEFKVNMPATGWFKTT